MPVVIAHLSDLHLGAHDEQALASVVDDVAAARPDVTVVTGDLTMRARTEQFDAARRFLDRLPPPLVLVLGNHDIPLYDALERFGSPYDRYRDGVHDRLDPHLDVEGARILGLASMPRWRWKSGRVSERQAGLVTQVLGAAPAGALRVLAMHHPPSARGAARVKGRRDLRAAMVEARVDVVLAGHTHVPSTTLLRLAVDGSPGRSSRWSLGRPRVIAPATPPGPGR